MANQKCPKCSEPLIQSLSFRTSFFKYFKVYTFLCCSCEFMLEKEIPISKDDYYNSMKDRAAKIKNKN